MRAFVLLATVLLAHLAFAVPEIGYTQIVPTLITENSDTDCQAVIASQYGGVDVSYFVWDSNASRETPVYSGKAECTGESWSLGKPCHSGFFNPAPLSGIITCHLSATNLAGSANKETTALRVCGENCSAGCGDEVCSRNETILSCAQDCIAEMFTSDISSPNWGETYNLGSEVTLTVILKRQEEPVQNASINVLGFFGEAGLFDDGAHGDGLPGDGVYSAKIMLPKNETGLRMLRILVTDGKESDISYALLNVSSELSVKGTVGASFKLGDIIPITAEISSNGRPAQGVAHLEFYSPTGKFAYSENQSFLNGSVSFVYHGTSNDELGDWVVRLSASDEFGNTGFWKGTFRLSKLAPGSFLDVELLSPAAGTYKRGTTISISARIKRAGSPVSGAKVVFATPKGAVMEMDELGDGAYGATYTIGYDDSLGSWPIPVLASVKTDSGTIEGSKSGNVVITPSELQIEITRPDRSEFQAGENIEIVSLVRYPGGNPVSAKTMVVTVSTDKIQMQKASEGAYVAYYSPGEAQTGELVLTIDAEDGFGNSGTKSSIIIISGTSIFYTLDKNKVIAIPLLMAVIIGLIAFVRTYVFHAEKQRLIKRKEEILGLQKKLQTEYLKEGTMDRKTFYEINAKYDSELKRIEWELLEGGKTK